MSIVFILILISAFSSYIIIVNDQVAYSYDIVVQLEKQLKSFYEIESVIYYVLDFYQKNSEEIILPFSKNFELDFSPEHKKMTFVIECNESGKDLDIIIIVFKVGLGKILTRIHCRFLKRLMVQFD